MNRGDAIKRLANYQAETAVILGSGLNSLVTEPGNADIIPYSDFPAIPKPSVPGHAGRFVMGNVGNTKVIFAQGRVHLYEGHSAHDVTAGVRVLAETGIKRLIVTNAAGAANPNFKPGEWMMITDHINLTGTTPLLGSVSASPARTFMDMTEAYSKRLQETFRKAANKIDLSLREGVYAALLGPQYETPAEVRMLQKLGADAVGMSTVLEVIQARALALEVAGFSCITNLAAGISKDHLSHQEVLETGKQASAKFARLLEAGL